MPARLLLFAFVFLFRIISLARALDVCTADLEFSVQRADQRLFQLPQIASMDSTSSALPRDGWGRVTKSVAPPEAPDGSAKLAQRLKMRLRLKLRHTALVEEVLHAFWTLAVRCSGQIPVQEVQYMQQAPSAAGRGRRTPPRLRTVAVEPTNHEVRRVGSDVLSTDRYGLLDVTIGFDGYFDLFSRAFKILVDCYSAYDQDETCRMLEEDFARDAKGNGTLTIHEYCDAIFELADLWVHDIGEASYAGFLWELFWLVATDDGGWRPADECAFVPSFAPPEDDDRKAKVPGRRHMVRAAKARFRSVRQLQSVVRGKMAREQQKERSVAAVKLQAALRSRSVRRVLFARMAVRKPPPPIPPTVRPRLQERPSTPPSRKRAPDIVPPSLTMTLIERPPAAETRWQRSYSCALSAGSPYGCDLPMDARAGRWTSIAVARPGRLRQPVASHVMPHVGRNGAAVYYAQHRAAPELLPAAERLQAHWVDARSASRARGARVR